MVFCLVFCAEYFFPSQFTLRMGQSLHLSLSNIDMYYVPLENKHHLPNYHITPSLSLHNFLNTKLMIFIMFIFKNAYT
jgi:hypothetical protein